MKKKFRIRKERSFYYKAELTDTENKLVVIRGEREAAEGQHTAWGVRGINY